MARILLLAGQANCPAVNCALPRRPVAESARVSAPEGVHGIRPCRIWLRGAATGSGRSGPQAGAARCQRTSHARAGAGDDGRSDGGSCPPLAWPPTLRTAGRAL